MLLENIEVRDFIEILLPNDKNSYLGILYFFTNFDEMIVEYFITFRPLDEFTSAQTISQYRKEIYFHNFVVINEGAFINEYNKILNECVDNYKPTDKLDYELLRFFDRNSNSFKCFFKTKYINKHTGREIYFHPGDFKDSLERI